MGYGEVFAKGGMPSKQMELTFADDSGEFRDLVGCMSKRFQNNIRVTITVEAEDED